MLGLLLRFLPFWVREPLLVALGSVLGVRLTYLAVHDHDRVTAGFGVVFLVFTAMRVHVVARALRARRNPGPATAPDGPAVDTAAQARAQVPPRSRVAAGPRPGPDKRAEEPNVWGQAVAAVAVFGALGAALWVAPRLAPSDDSTAQPPSCSDTEDGKPPKAYAKNPRAVTGAELCEVLNRPDLARLLGTPGETATTVSGTDNTAPLTGGKVAQPEAEVGFDTYTVHLTATYDKLSTAQYAKLVRIAGDEGEKDLRTVTVLGRPALFSSEHTLKLDIGLAEGSSGPVEQGPLARTLSVALDRKDRGGSYDITVWSASGALPDDGVLLDIAEKVLPAIPERRAG